MPKRARSAAAPGLPDVIARRAIEATILRLINVLDGLDPDPDFEPSLGWANDPDANQARIIRGGDQGGALDAEGDDAELEADVADVEPSLGAPAGGDDQSFWAQGALDDAEWTDANDDRHVGAGYGVRAARGVVAAVEAEIVRLAARLRGQPGTVAGRHLRWREAIVTGPDGSPVRLRTCG